MLKSEINSDNDVITAHFVYRQPITIEQSSSAMATEKSDPTMPIEQSSLATTFIFPNHPLTHENKLNCTRSAQEKLLSGNSDPSYESEFEEDIPENQNSLPKSCLRVFTFGVINIIKDAANKYFGAKR